MSTENNKNEMQFKDNTDSFDMEDNKYSVCEEIEETVRELLLEGSDDFEELEEYIEEHEDNYPDDLAEYVFRLAVQLGNTEYVEEHADDFDLNDGDGCSTYLDETDDEEMLEILMNHGAFRSWDDYDDCMFAVETVDGSIIAFDSNFQQEVFEKYKDEFDFTDEDLQQMLDDDEYDDDSDRDVEYDLNTIGVSFEDGDVVFEDMCDCDGYALKDLLEELGWDVEFEGVSGGLETNGVYFIR